MSDPFSPFGPTVPEETRIIPTVEVSADTDELVIRIPGAQLMAMRHPQAEKSEPRQKSPDDENIVVLVCEEAGYHRYTWICDLSRSDNNVAEHQMLLMAIFGAMSAEDNTLADLDQGALRIMGGTSPPAQSLHAAPPCYVDCRVVLREKQ